MDVSPLEKQEFMLSALTIAKEQGFIWQGVTDPHDEHLSRLYTKWGGDPELKRFETVEKALIDFRTRLMSGLNRLKEKLRDDPREIKIQALGSQLAIPIGNGREVTFTASGTIPVDATPDELKYYYGKLFQVTFQGFMEFKKNPPQVLSPQNQYTHTGDTATEQFEFYSIKMAQKEGKRFFNVYGDKFPLHGVPVYLEVLQKAGLQPEKMGDVTSVVGVATFIKNQKGEAHKVVHLQVMA